MKMTIKSGHCVVVIAGKDKGKTGKVTAVYADENRVLVDNVNIVSKHQKPRSQQDKGGIFKRPAPIEASNVMVVCPVCGKATRVGHKEVDGKKFRACKKCGASLDKEFVKATKKEAKKAIKASDLKGANLKAASTEEKPAKKTAKTSETKETTKKTAAKSTATKTAAKTTKTAAASEKPAAKTTAKKTATKKSTAEAKESK